MLYINILKTARFEIISYCILGRTSHEEQNLALCSRHGLRKSDLKPDLKPSLKPDN